MLTLESLKADDEVVASLSDLCDFELQDDAPERPFCSVEGVSDLTVFARDGSGGQFVMSPSGQVFYFSSEGGGGLLAEDLTALVRLLVYRPYWQDLLKYSARGNLDEMRRADVALAEDWWLEETSLSARDALKDHLDLEPEGDVVAKLHKAASTALIIRNAWESPAEPLFGRFTIDDNPMLRTTG